MDRRLGGPLPLQLANQTRVHLIPPEFFTPYHAVLCAYAVLAVISNCYPPVWGRLPTRYSPVRHSVTRKIIPKKSISGASFDLHVLSTPPAFILSQDQTLWLKMLFSVLGSFRLWMHFFIRDDNTCTRLCRRPAAPASEKNVVHSSFTPVQDNYLAIYPFYCL